MLALTPALSPRRGGIVVSLWRIRTAIFQTTVSEHEIFSETIIIHYVCDACAFWWPLNLMKKLNVGLVGYGFMGRTHSNAFRKVNNFFDLQYEPVLKTICARDGDKAAAFAKKWGYE